MATEKDERAYPATRSEKGYCPWCEQESLLTAQGGFGELAKYRCENCGEEFYV
jgi:transposase-like protein